MKKSFTLIEILIATMILVVASISFLDFSNHSKNIFSFFDTQKKINLKSTIILNSNIPKKNIYENLINFKIDNDKIIHELKKDNFNFKSEIDYTQKIDNFNLIIQKEKVYNKHHQNIVYKVEIK